MTQRKARYDAIDRNVMLALRSLAVSAMSRGHRDRTPAGYRRVPRPAAFDRLLVRGAGLRFPACRATIGGVQTLRVTGV
jgi:hypothetical protein